MSYDVLFVADTILKVAKTEGKALTPIELMKLTYLVHGWSLGTRGRALVRNRIEAWKHGPILPELYTATRGYGRGPIPLDAIDDPEDIPLDDGDYEFVKGVYEKHRGLSGVELASLANQPGSPWDAALKAHGPDARAEITDQLIEHYYRNLAGLA